MSSLNLGIEIRDFDLERMGFSLSVLDESRKRQASEAYLRMTLTELDVFLKALKAAQGDLEITTYDSSGVNKLPPLKGSGEGGERRSKKDESEAAGCSSASISKRTTPSATRTSISGSKGGPVQPAGGYRR
jgi:hypothetical protein